MNATRRIKFVCVALLVGRRRLFGSERCKSTGLQRNKLPPAAGSPAEVPEP